MANRAQRRALKFAARLQSSQAQPQQLSTAAAVAVVESENVSAPAAAAAAASTVSIAQLEANRRNAQFSTGAKTQAGLAISSQNRTTHGLARHNGAFRLLTSEDPNGFEALKRELALEHKPQTPTESILVQSMAESHWLAQRALRLQDTCLCPDTGVVTNEKMFTLYIRYHSTHTRAFHKSLSDLLKLRKEKRIAQNGFEAQRRKDECHEMKKILDSEQLVFKEIRTQTQRIMKQRQERLAQKEDPGFEAQYHAEGAA